jgi:hypothetical protein
MSKTRTHPYLTKEFWEQNKYWKNDMHKNHEAYEERINNILDSFKIKEDFIFNNLKTN